MDARHASAYGLVILAMYFLITTQVSVQSNRSSLKVLSGANATLTSNNATLTKNNANLIATVQQQRAALDRLNLERRARDALLQKQADEIRRLGGQQVDVFDPNNTGGVTIDKNGNIVVHSSSPSPRPSSRPSPRTTRPPSQRPSPQPTRTTIVPLPVPVPTIVPCIRPLCGAVAPTAFVPMANFTQGAQLDPTVTFDFNHWDATSVARLLGLVIPLLVGVLTKRYATSGVKAVVNVALSAFTGSVGYLVAANGHDYNFAGFVNSFLSVMLVSMASYYGLWKPTGVAGTVAVKTAKFGIGSPPTLETDDKGKEDAPPPPARKRASKRSP
jgi:hypothetical protein